jgi:hypothetical protein
VPAEEEMDPGLENAVELSLTPLQGEPEPSPTEKEAVTFQIHYPFADLPEKQKEDVLGEIQRVGSILIYDPEWVRIESEKGQIHWFLGMIVEHKNIFKDTGETAMKQKLLGALRSMEISFRSIDEYPDEEWGKTEYMVYFKPPRFSIKVASEHLQNWQDQKLQGFLKYKVMRSLRAFFKNPLQSKVFKSY